MYQFPNSIQITETLQLESRQESDKFLAASVMKNEYVTPEGGENNRDIGQLYFYYNEYPILEDARRHWVIHFYELGDYLTREEAEAIVDVLIERYKITEPVKFYRGRQYPYDGDKDFSVQRGKIFPDD